MVAQEGHQLFLWEQGDGGLQPGAHLCVWQIVHDSRATVLGSKSKEAELQPVDS